MSGVASLASVSQVRRGGEDAAAANPTTFDAVNQASLDPPITSTWSGCGASSRSLGLSNRDLGVKTAIFLKPIYDAAPCFWHRPHRMCSLTLRAASGGASDLIGLTRHRDETNMNVATDDGVGGFRFWRPIVVLLTRKPIGESKESNAT